MIKAVILDFGGVLFKDKPREHWNGITQKLNIDLELWNRAGLGEVNEESLFEEIGKNHEVSADEIKKWLFSRREPNKDILDLLNELKPGIKKAVINNGLRTLFRGYLAKYELSIEFDVMVNSAEEGVKKPDPEIYLRTCERLGVEPKDCLFVDDDEKNIKGAKKVGMKTLFYTSFDDFKNQMQVYKLI